LGQTAPAGSDLTGCVGRSTFKGLGFEIYHFPGMSNPVSQGIVSSSYCFMAAPFSKKHKEIENFLSQGFG
jgi:hypothetical protein